MSEQEEIWVREALAGNKQAFNRLVEAYQRPVFNLAYRMLGNPDEAEDAAQETFLRAYGRLTQYDSSHKFSTWILSIANHHCIDRLRKRRMTYVSIDDNPVLENLEQDGPEPEQSLLGNEESVELQTLINQLEPDYRTPLILRYWEDYSYEDIATAMGLTVSAVKSRLFRARKQMADLYHGSQTVPTPPPPGNQRSTVAGRGKQATTDAPFILRTAVASW